jgi:hypothetical protein
LKKIPKVKIRRVVAAEHWLVAGVLGAGAPAYFFADCECEARCPSHKSPFQTKSFRTNIHLTAFNCPLHEAPFRTKCFRSNIHVAFNCPSHEAPFRTKCFRTNIHVAFNCPSHEAPIRLPWRRCTVYRGIVSAFRVVGREIESRRVIGWKLFKKEKKSPFRTSFRTNIHLPAFNHKTFSKNYVPKYVLYLTAMDKILPNISTRNT